MSTMRSPRQAIALATILVVAWTALWPLVSAAHSQWMGEEVMLCHQAGMMVAPGEAPQKAPQGPGSKPGETHCPLCIMAFYGSAAAPLAVPSFEFSTLSVHLAVYDATPSRDFPVALPQGRAPPTSLPL
jgi:hypothetical protein